MAKYLWLVFLLILIFLLVSKRNETGKVINALSGANVKTIEALQGRFSQGV
jgi:hypothetical protein